LGLEHPSIKSLPLARSRPEGRVRSEVIGNSGHDVHKRSHLRPVTGNSPGEGELTGGLSRLRKSSNWSGFRPQCTMTMSEKVRKKSAKSPRENEKQRQTTINDEKQNRRSEGLFGQKCRSAKVPLPHS
jgi:hypothetical protein